MAQAQDTGDWIWRVGVHNVRPKSDNHAVVNVDTGASLTFNGTYLFAPNWGVEVLAAMPFAHDINLNGGGKVAETKHLPPTLGALSGTKLELGPSWGLAAQLGMAVTMARDAVHLLPHRGSLSSQLQRAVLPTRRAAEQFRSSAAVVDVRAHSVLRSALLLLRL